MDYLTIILSAFLSLIILFILTKLIGYRQVSSMSLYDYINSITLGSIAADLAMTDNPSNIPKISVAMVIYGLFTYFCAVACEKSRRARRFITGEPIVLMNEGKLYKKNFNRANLDIEEFLSSVRSLGYFDITKLHTVILETSGKVSVLPLAGARPVTPDDQSLSVSEEKPEITVIEDGVVIHEHLKKSGYDDTYLNKQLEKAKIKRKDVFLGIIGASGEFSFYRGE